MLDAEEKGKTSEGQTHKEGDLFGQEFEWEGDRRERRERLKNQPGYGLNLFIFLNYLLGCCYQYYI